MGIQKLSLAKKLKIPINKIAIELNKSTEQITFYKNLESFKNNKQTIFNKIVDLH